MTTTLIRQSQTAERLTPLAGPLLVYVDQFDAVLNELGFSTQVRDKARQIVRTFSDWLGRQQFEAEQIDETILHRYREYQASQGLQRHGANAALGRLLAMLRDSGVCSPHRSGFGAPANELLAEFRDHLVQHRGLAPVTIKQRMAVATQFMAAQSVGGATTRRGPSGKDVLTFIRRRAKNNGSETAKQLCAGMRAWLRYLQFRGLIVGDLAECVPSVAQWRFASIPKHLTPAQLQTVLEFPDRATAAGKRDYAILLLLSQLGLRANEVTTLLLDHIDWPSGQFNIRAKGRRRAQFPLNVSIGAAVADYLEHGRPRSNSRRVFLRHSAPYIGFLDSSGVSTLVARIFRSTQINVGTRGAHVLRHTFATQMLRAGASLAQIGQVMGHRALDTTRVYAKVDEAALRPLALPWPGDAT